MTAHTAADGLQGLFATDSAEDQYVNPVQNGRTTAIEMRVVQV